MGWYGLDCSGSVQGPVEGSCEHGWLPSAVYIMECPLCSRGFRNKFNLKVHMRDVHGDDQGPFSCPECGKQVKNRSCLRVHLYRRHQALKNISHSPVTLRKTQ
ncbi:hypothetical protein B7P43_G12664 [Cryptotermes secundus]|uniref:C2H2-type domain-containing protein n=1 Tax=Cryptotermes secundus TaxID=105785 RepID=A0A2J7QRT8_9NEOP|nr:hypothetical protein B7P43_G12664 [Cryptotermes secundus]